MPTTRWQGMMMEMALCPTAPPTACADMWASPHLDGAYAAFGKVLEGMEVAEDIVNTRRDYNDRPMTPQVMKSVRVETYGVDYPFEQM